MKFNQYSIVSTDDFFWVPTFLVKKTPPLTPPLSRVRTVLPDINIFEEFQKYFILFYSIWEGGLK